MSLKIEPDFVILYQVFLHVEKIKISKNSNSSEATNRYNKIRTKIPVSFQSFTSWLISFRLHNQNGENADLYQWTYPFNTYSLFLIFK